MAFADFWRIISAIGDFQLWAVIILLSLIAYIFSPKSRKQRIAWLAFVLVPSLIVSAALVEFSKISIQIPRPCTGNEECPSGYSFPSGHAARIFVFATVVTLSMKNIAIKLSSLTLAILVSLSRVALNYHAYTDIVAGALLGTAVAYLINTLYKRKSSSIKASKRIIS
jgi:membrane-associated phospholipid phosphatase